MSGLLAFTSNSLACIHYPILTMIPKVLSHKEKCT